MELTAKQKMINALAHLNMVQDEVRDLHNNHPQSFMYSPKMHKLNNVVINLETAAELMNEIIENMQYG